jgi:hypothetical protein
MDKNINKAWFTMDERSIRDMSSISGNVQTRSVDSNRPLRRLIV